MRNEIAESGMNRFCAIEDCECWGGIQWHHVWIYAGRQINEPWAILGGCEGHHKRVDGDMAVRDAFRKKSLQRATLEDLSKYPRFDWEREKRRLGLST